MSTVSRFILRNKVIVLNFVLAIAFFFYNPWLLREVPESWAPDYHYLIGVLVLIGLFFEFAFVYYKGRFIYSRRGARDHKPPFLLAITFFPRLIISGVIITFAFRLMGLLDVSDFVLLLIALYAAAKEFWVRSRLMKPEDSQAARDPQWKRTMADVFFVLFVLISYTSVWEAFLLGRHHVLQMLMYPPNWTFLGLGFLLILYSLEMPYFLEEHMTGRSRRHMLASFLSLCLPALGPIWHVAQEYYGWDYLFFL